jgi:hypothetical protein
MKLVDMRALGARAYGVSVRVRPRAKQRWPSEYREPPLKKRERLIYI